MLNASIAIIPLAVVVVAVLCIVHGLVRFLRGDESMTAVVWAIVVPLLVVPVGLGLQMLLVKLATHIYGSAEDEPEDESSFL